MDADRSAAQFRASVALAQKCSKCGQIGHANGRSPLCKDTDKFKKKQKELAEMRKERAAMKKRKSTGNGGSASKKSRR